uniref:NADH-ubiquinone oxidoreductase chain 6 n=2 Tax=Cetomimidae TaxID=88666 RepID=B9ECP8_9TELE|nr:NADH dehydrogenase subunit 6 [Eutaeniophorus festivus]YP_002586814.1 NADH dehydrogenase subunit 6 [Ataxolepis apus]BAH15283.1 NADH dehydrogenase subunit 6 [Eutaeniophorus festivus]BAH15309.1 NADH dehydrogenase subunit 6 [Ataxolepis apus]
MTYLMSFLLVGLVVGLIAVASNPSPFFAALGLVVVAGLGCGLLVGHGGPFLSLVLFLIYLGGMLVVFAYSAALAAEPFPESWGNWSVFGQAFIYFMGVALAFWYFRGGWSEVCWVPVEELKMFSIFRGDMGGVPLVYSFGGGMLLISVWVLFLALLVVLELTRGVSRGALRAI